MQQNVSGKGAIHQTMQLIAGRTEQEYNQRKNRKGALGKGQKSADKI